MFLLLTVLFVVVTDQSQADQNEVLKDHDDMSPDDDDQGGSIPTVNQAPEDQSSLKELSGNDQRSPKNDQDSPVNPEGKLSNQSLGNEPDQANQSNQNSNDHDAVDDQDDQNTNTQNANSDQDEDEVKTDQDKTKPDQDEEPPSTPPHMTNASTDSQATEIIRDSSPGNQASGSDGDDEGQTPSDKDNRQHSSEDETENQYDRPWYKFWGSSDIPVS